MKISVILYNLRSLHNVGSIFRTSDAAGVERIYLCGITPGPTDRLGNLRPQFAKVALGAEKTVPWEKIGSSAQLIKKLKREGSKILAVEQSKKSVPYYKAYSDHSDAVRDVRIVLIFGNEVRGLPPSILKAADKILEIPMRGAMVRQPHHPRHWRGSQKATARRVGRRKESLNVSVAFGIVVFSLRYPKLW